MFASILADISRRCDEGRMKVAFGCLASVAYFAALMALVASSFMAECFTAAGEPCVTDPQRSLRTVAVFVIGVAIYGIFGFFMERWARRRNGD